MRDVAADARVDAALVHYFFGTKRELFGAAMELRVNPADALAAILAGPREELADRLLRRFLAVWDDAEARPPLMAMVRSAMTDEHAAASLREFIVEEIVGPLARAGGTADAEFRATLVGSQLLGLINARYILRVEPLASAGHDAMVAAIAPVLQRYLTGDLKPRPGTQARSG